MKPLGKTIRVHGKYSTNWNDEIREYVRSYNATPHSTTEIAPRTLLFKTSSCSTRLPVNQSSKEPFDNLRKVDSANKAKMKIYADRKLNTKPCEIKINNQVLLKQARTQKNKPNFDPEPFTVTSILGNMATIIRDGKSYARNVSDLKKFVTAKQTKVTIQAPSDNEFEAPS